MGMTMIEKVVSRNVGKAVKLEEDDSMTSSDVKVINASVYSIADGGDA